jgi:hypothetical protein
MPKPIQDFACFSEGVNLARIVEFINTYDTFQREDGDFSTRHINWQLAHLTSVLPIVDVAAARPSRRGQ